MSNDKNNEFHGEVMTPDLARKQILEIGLTNRVPPDVGIFDEPTRCFKANLEWTPLIMGMVHWLADVTAWQEAGDEGYFAIREILRFMQGEDCMSLQLRQKPDDDCVLQQSLDGGDTWTDVFDFSLCVTIQDKTYQSTIQNQVIHNAQTFQDIYNDYTTNYAGLPGDVHANLANPSGDDSALRAALCNALWEMVRTACNSAVSFYTESVNQTQQELNFLLAVAGFTFTAIALAAAIPSAGTSLIALAAITPEIALGVGLGAGLANFLVDFWQQHTIDQFQDTAAMEDVVCHLFSCLDGTDVSLVNMRGCVDDTIAGTNQQAIMDYLEILMAHDSTYAAFLEKWANNEQFARAGIELYCPCMNGYQVWSWDFANGMGDWQFDDFFGAGNFGQLANGRIQATGGNDQKIISIALNGFNPAWRVVGARVYVERNTATAQGNNDIGLALRPTPDSTTGQYALITGQHQSSGAFQVCNVVTVSPFYDDGTNQLYLFTRITKTAASPAVQMYLYKVEVQFVEGYAKGGYITDDNNICS